MAGIRLRPARQIIRSATAATVVVGLVVTIPAQTLHTQEAEPSETSTVADDEPGEKGKKKKKEKKARGGRFLPIPIFITEPAIGVGLGVALAYFHKREGDVDSESSIPRAMTAGTPGAAIKKKKPPPTISTVVGAYADSGSWGGGFAHSTSWRKDRIRYSGALAYMNVKSTIYRFDVPFDFDIKGGILHQNLKFRLGESNFFLGGKLSALASEAAVELGIDRPFELGEGDATDVGLAAQALFETRDNTMTPNQGMLIELAAWRYDEALGGDYNYWRLDFKFNSFHRLSNRFVLGWRIETEAVDGKPPFWSYPWVTLRGVPAMRYQNERVGVLEIEGRYNLADRWGVVGFVGRGKTDGDNPAFETQDRIFAGGVGGRYFFLPEEDLWVGIDIARGPEDTYWYIQVGHAW
jgi:hypothetical protein